jgi:hypothetical protein
MATARARKTRQTADARKAQVLELRELFDGYTAEQSAEQIAMITAQFDGYSERNAVLIAAQCPTATDVSGFHAWHDRGRKVCKGAHGIKILAPAGSKPGTTEPVGEQSEQGAVHFFRVAYVFDISATESAEGQPSGLVP